MFEPFQGVPDYPTLEQAILDFWDREKIFEQLVHQNREGEPWRFQDGPITANNPMGVHHAWGRTYKDVFCRYHAMRGRRQRFQNGFDCQGLWVEVEVEKALGFRGKPDILNFGLENFSRACRERVDQYAEVITSQSRRLGQWMDWDHSYYTFDDSNIEHIWLFLKRCHEEGWLSQDYRIMPWCPRCETSLSQHESADSYKEIVHRSVFIKLPVLGPAEGSTGGIGWQPGDQFLVWTTTPWTLAANVALAIHPDLTYVRARSGEDVLIVSAGTAATALRPGYEILEEVPGSRLLNLCYRGPFDDLPAQVALQDATPRRTVPWEEVGEGEGTGIVHVAPGCGAEDFELGKREGLGFIVPVDGSAVFNSACGPLEGRHALADVELIFEALRERDRLYRIQRYTHSYPHCWRCDEELIFYAVQEWFIRVDAGARPARERLRKAAATVEWIPEYAGKRMDDWLANMGDWCISRKRFWGLPLPIYQDEAGQVHVVGSREELRRLAVQPELVDALPELHRPWIDAIELRSPDGGVMTRVPEVGDAWLDAGIVPFATTGYNGATDLRLPADGEPHAYWEDWYPADFITEMREQVRLWFFSMLFMSVALEDRAPYRRAMVYETMLDQNGERISKTKGNGVPYAEAVERIGADTMRWTFCSNPLNRDIRFGYGPIHESGRRLLTLWNVYSFFVTYANLDQPALRPETEQPAGRMDRWILARLQELIAEVTACLDRVEPAGVTRGVEAFVEDLSNWYVRSNRRRFWKNENDHDKAAAYQTLYSVLLTLCRLIAPVIPFTAEAMFQNLRRAWSDAPASVHLCPWPVVQPQSQDRALVEETARVMEMVSLGHAARKASRVKVRQPLPRVLVQAPSAAHAAALEAWQEVVLEELNVKALEFLAGTGDLVTYSLKPNLPRLGPRLGRRLREVKAALEDAPADEARRMGEAAQAGQQFSLRVGDEELTFEPDDVLVQTQQQTGYSFASGDGWSVALDTTLNDELLAEGLARDVVRLVQNLRKEAGLEVSDHIRLRLAPGGGDELLPRALRDYSDYLRHETLADVLEITADGDGLQSVDLGEHELKIGLEKHG